MLKRRNVLWQRGTLEDFLGAENHPGRLILWESIMAVLALFYLTAALEADNVQSDAYQTITLVFSAIFLTEFAARCYDTRRRGLYVRGHWLDVVSSIPLIGPLRAVLILRLLRLLIPLNILVRLGDTAKSVRDTIWFLLPSVLVLWTASAYAIWLLEHGVAGSHVRTYFDALRWSLVTVTTLGYSDTTPVTPGGEVVAALLVLVGIGLVGAASSRLAAHWLHDDEATKQLHAEVASLREEVQNLQTLHRDLVRLELLLSERLGVPQEPVNHVVKSEIGHS